MVAIMLEQLAVRPGMRVLEIGAGTGYNAALLAELAGPSGQVTTVDLDADTAARAHDHLRAVGYGPDRVRIVCDDGWHGFASHAPYDRIICTAGVWEVPPAWMAQLAPEGRIVVPLAVQTAQFCLALDRQGESLVSAGMPCCGFMRLRGPFAGPEATLATPAGVRMLADPPTPSPEQLATLLTAPPRPHPLPFAGRIELLRAVLAVLGAHVVSVFGVPAGSCPAGVGILTPDGESACIITAADTCSALCATYGSEAAGEQADACLLRWQALGSSPPERWRCTLVPAELAPSLTETCAIHRKRNWNVVVQL
jgi:protein-L-isoaspartate O-methyltransferase